MRPHDRFMMAISLKQLHQICFVCVEIALLVKPVILNTFNDHETVLINFQCLIVVLHVKKKDLLGKPKISLRT